MAFEERDQSGSLFKNERKERDSQPDYTGKAIVNGTPVYVSAWLKEGKNGKFLSLGFKNREAGAFDGTPTQRQLDEYGKPGDDSEIPF